eukprot:CAMPEP_0183397734 /NCGR_PEP_ID=MMETSP0370-20130417/10797_1 /TAXON_ID=268820 /ORGANISM="Peridinium aciculiferum, Strain PAER-2" /LENGTH=530 /DNA_ID=CAMNT_0025578667 /DNA_START=53 /DNA_END=1645 /DNA_ORIENTATION=-
MAIQKRKAVGKISAAGSPSKRSAMGSPSKRTKVSAAGSPSKLSAMGSPSKRTKAQKKEEEEPEVEEPENEEEAEEEEEQEEEEEISEEDRIVQEEEELKTSRKKELKAMYIDELKQVATSKGVEPCKKEDMIEAVVVVEAEERAAARAYKAKLRAVVVSKKDALEALPLPELRDVCNDYGIKGQLTKQARIEQILKLWQEADGVDRALAKIATDERAQELNGMEKAALRKLCEKAGVEPFVREVLVERLVRVEHTAGKFARPTIPAAPVEEEEEKPKKGKKADMVDALLEQESRRKKDLELKKTQEGAEASKRKELKAMSVDELKKALSKQGLEAAGKKDDMVETLYQVQLLEEALAARKSDLRALPIDVLKKQLAGRGLAAGKKEDMIDAWLAHEAKLVEAAKGYETKIEEVLAKMKAELEAKTANDLKDMCADKNLKLGIGKDGRIETLLEDARANGEVYRAIAALARRARAEELLAMEQGEVLRLCEEAQADPLVKEVLVERLLAHEAIFGRVPADAEPKAKRARKA